MMKQSKLIFPVVGLSLLFLLWSNICLWYFVGVTKKNILDNLSISAFIRVIFAVIFTFGMEYVARYEHKYLWHSRWIWFIHASHHHQRSRFGAGPSKHDAESNKYVSPKDSTFELNDIFPAVFSTTAMIIIYWGILPPGSMTKDIAFGSAVGISIYGTSYFIGHDLCAHERGGKSFAMFLRQWFPLMAKCADVHNLYHHKIDLDADEDSDPYGAPYGFWLGPREIEAMKR